MARSAPWNGSGNRVARRDRAQGAVLRWRDSPVMDRPDLIAEGGKQLTRTERFTIAAIRRTFEPGPFDRAVRLL